MTREVLAELKAQVAELERRTLADLQTIAILQANITLVVDNADHTVKEAEKHTNELVAEKRALVVRLGEIEKQTKDTVHRLNSLRTAVTATMDYLDKVDPMPTGTTGGKAGSA